MKILHFTHSQDIDGMGCAILGQKAFSNYTLVPTKTFDVNISVDKYIQDKAIYCYDKVFVTDLCIKEPLLKYIDDNKELKDKIIVLDHHKTEIEEGNNEYDFVNIIVEKDGIKESGTSLFYKYLLENRYIKQDKILDQLVEWTRQYDVWDWEKNNNYNARKLHILFEVLGYEKYLELIYYKIKNLESIEFNDLENKIIDDFENALKRNILNYLKDMKIVNLEINNTKYKIGFIKCMYKYRNDINEFIIKSNNEYKIDVVGMIMLDFDTVSYRQIKDVDVSIIAKEFGGKGHRSASSNPKNNEKFKKLLERL